MTGQWIAALRWGLPSEHPITAQPLLARLTFQFEQFANHLQGQFDWADDGSPKVVSYECLLAAWNADQVISDPWLGRFLLLSQDMRRLTRHAHPANPREAYLRYQQWLPFAWRAEQMISAVSWDLDYRPLGRGGEQPRSKARTVPLRQATAQLEDHPNAQN